jgi:hypothetical protein
MARLVLPPTKSRGKSPTRRSAFSGKLKKATRAEAAKTSPFHLALSASVVDLLDEGGQTDHRFRQLLYDFSTLGASLEVARSYLASQLGISPPQYNIAMILANHQNTGGISVSDVAKRLHVSTAFITLEAGPARCISAPDASRRDSGGQYWPRTAESE